MAHFKTIGLTICTLLLISLCIGLVAPAIAMAMPASTTGLSYIPPGDTEEKPQESIEINCQYPALKNPAGTIFQYDIDLAYKNGDKPKYFNIEVTVPEGFISQVTQSYGDTEIPGLTLDPAKSYSPDKIKLKVLSFGVGPGEYPIKLRVFSDDLSNSIDLKAIITAKYEVKLTTPDGRLNMEATANKNNLFTMTVTNTGTDVLEQLKFSSSLRGAPSGWEITFDPKEIDSLAAGESRDIKVTVKPPQKTISGDYQASLTVKPDKKYNVEDTMDVRITVVTATIWGWVGVGIVVLVIIGLVIMFLRLGRR
jgi:uncharacterized membrane protein